MTVKSPNTEPGLQRHENATYSQNQESMFQWSSKDPLPQQWKSVNPIHQQINQYASQHIKQMQKQYLPDRQAMQKYQYKMQLGAKETKTDEDLPYVSKVTDDLVVMGTEDIGAFNKVKAETDKKLIGTHSDAFHCDEVLATTMLLYTKQYKNSIIVRTRT